MTGSKTDLINTLKSKDLEFVTIISKPLSGTKMYFLRTKMSPGILPNAAAGQEEIERIGNLSVTLNVLRQFRESYPILDDAMEISMSLFQRREQTIFDAHTEVNAGKNHYERYLTSFYLPYSFTELLIENPQRLDIKERFFGPGFVAENTRKLFILWKHNFNPFDGNPRWILLVADIASFKIAFMDPALDSDTNPFDQQQLNFCQAIEVTLNPFLNSLRTGDWKCRPSYQRIFASPVVNAFDRGIYILALVFFVSSDTPVYFTEESLKYLRFNFAYWLMCTELPF